MANNGILKVVSEGELQQRDAEDALDNAFNPIAVDALAAHIRGKFEEFKSHKDSEKITDRELHALRAYRGEYSAQKLADIAQLGGSKVFSKLTAVKCRGATALLRDVFLGPELPWELAPTPEPTIPDNVNANIERLVVMEMREMEARGIPLTSDQIEKRRDQLFIAAKRTTLKTAKDAAKRAETKIHDILVEGGFRKALTQFLIDLPIFPLAVIKGPIVRVEETLKWVDGKATIVKQPKLCWERVSCIDIYMTPGAASIDDAEVIERIRLSRRDLNALIGLPGYNEEAIRKVLSEYDSGYTEAGITSDSERSDLENRENPQSDNTDGIDSLEFHGMIKGSLLLDKGFSKDVVEDKDLDYAVTSWVVGNHVIKTQINPNPHKRHPYFATSYEQVPGSPIGQGVPEIIEDAQDVANAALRSLVNNMSIASGPQVAVNEDRLSAGCTADNLYPWKRWRFTSDPMGSNEKVIDFFQPKSNASELLGVYKEMAVMADEVSAIPRYMTGSNNVGGAGRTASGLSMLMNNSSKVLQNVAASIDTEIMEPLLKRLYNMIMLTDTTGLLNGDEQVVVRGVQVAVQKEQDRMRRLEFLQITANPMDAQIVGPTGRASILRALATDLGLPEESIVPTNEEIEATQKAIESQQAAQAQGGQAPRPGSGGGPAEETDNAFRTGGIN